MAAWQKAIEGFTAMGERSTLRRVLKPLTRAVRELRWARGDWSKTSDQRFHESLYGGRDFDPFTFAYPGYVTIRRFADLAAEFLPADGTVLDLGCGPGEITCELARRRPDLRFVGIDHSTEAIARARKNAERAGLVNTRFEAGDAEAYTPPGEVGLVAMFDAFHHVGDPAALVQRLGRHTSHVLLIEPRGNWHGGWQKDLEFDWLLADMDNIRRRVAHLCGDAGPAEAPPAGANAAARVPTLEGEPVERRYALDDLERFFVGWRLDLRGTVAGFERYPPEAQVVSPDRERFGRMTYELVRSVDESLAQRDRDLLAKHWVVHAERGAGNGATRRPPAAHGPAAVPTGVSGPYDVVYLHYAGPTDARPDDRLLATVRLQNRGWEAWSSHAERPVLASYHWLDRDGQVLEFDGLRTALPRVLGPGETCEVALQVRAPGRPGRCILAIDLVHEQVTWFSQAGQPCMEVPFTVRRA